MKRNPEKALSGLIIATGVSSVVSQLLILREYLTQFQGNEYVIALIFFTWLLMGGLGSALAALLTPGHFKTDAGRLAALSFPAAVLPLATLLVIRTARDAVFTFGASTGFYATCGFILITLAPYGILVGFLLPYSLAVLRTYHPGYPAARVYILDNIGDCIGGALFAFVLIALASPFQAVTLTAGLLTLAAVNLRYHSEKASLRTSAAPAAVIIILAAGLCIETASLNPAGGELAWYRESRYGRVTVVRQGEQATVFADGVPLTSNLEVAAAEAAIHYPMAQTTHPGTVLIVSAGGGMFVELEKYRPASVDYVELNPEIATAQFQFGLLKKIAGLTVISTDGRAYLAETDRKYDAVIVNISDPETFQANRYYTAAFYRLVKTRLNPGGVMSFSVKGYANYLSEPKRRIISSLYRTVKKQFKHVMVLPGERIFFICSEGRLDRDIPELLARRNIRTDYVSGYYEGNVTADRIDALARQLIPEIPMNTDTAPYLMRLMFDRWFEKFATSPKWLYMALAVLLGLYFIKMSREEYLLFSTGFMTMGSEIMVIFACQIFFGYIYAQISLVVTVFLAGLLPGALLGQRLGRNPVAAMRMIDGLLIVLAVLLALLILPENARPAAGSLLAFGFGVSFLCGCQFPLALRSGGEGRRQTAFAFTADLGGAACGALLTSVLLIPYLGLAGTLVALIGLKISSLLVTGFKGGRLKVEG